MNIDTTTAILQLSQPSATRADVAGLRTEGGNALSLSVDHQNPRTFANVFASVLSSTSAGPTGSDATPTAASAAPSSMSSSNCSPTSSKDDARSNRPSHPRKDKARTAETMIVPHGQHAEQVSAAPTTESIIAKRPASPTGSATVDAAADSSAKPSSSARQNQPGSSKGEKNISAKEDQPAIPSPIAITQPHASQTPPLDAVPTNSPLPVPATPANRPATSADQPVTPSGTPPTGNFPANGPTTIDISTVAPALGANSLRAESPVLDNPPDGRWAGPPATTAAAATTGDAISVVAVPGAAVSESSRIPTVQVRSQDLQIPPAVSAMMNEPGDPGSAIATEAVTSAGLSNLNLNLGFAAFRQAQKDIATTSAASASGSVSAPAAQQVFSSVAQIAGRLAGGVAGATDAAINQEAAGTSRAVETLAKNPNKPETAGSAQLPDPSATQGNTGSSGNPSPSSTTSVPIHSVSSRVSEIVGQQLDKPASSGSSSVVLRLDPPELGRVNVHVSLTNDVVSIRMVASDEAARRAIEGQLNDLHRSLTNQGLSVNQCQVDCGASGQQSFDRGTPANVHESLPFASRQRSIPVSCGTGNGVTPAHSQLNYVA